MHEQERRSGAVDADVRPDAAERRALDGNFPGLCLRVDVREPRERREVLEAALVEGDVGGSARRHRGARYRVGEAEEERRR
jgi:hypothetical protein